MRTPRKKKKRKEKEKDEHKLLEWNEPPVAAPPVRPRPVSLGPHQYLQRQLLDRDSSLALSLEPRARPVPFIPIFERKRGSERASTRHPWLLDRNLYRVLICAVVIVRGRPIRPSF